MNVAVAKFIAITAYIMARKYRMVTIIEGEMLVVCPMSKGIATDAEPNANMTV
jgi:hypothetical protein